MRKGYVKDEYWYDKDDQPHHLQSMDDNYLENVGKMLSLRMDKWRESKRDPDELKTDENFLQDVRSLVFVVAEQERRKNVLETKVGGLLYD